MRHLGLAPGPWGALGLSERGVLYVDAVSWPLDECFELALQSGIAPLLLHSFLGRRRSVT
jgi:hypothetical protein